jgi:hypothetical protein
MPSYRRHVARHPLALARALRAVRAHAMQTGPQDPNHWSVHAVPMSPFETIACRMMDEAKKLVPVGVPSIVRYVRENLSCQVCGHRHERGQMCQFMHVDGHCGCDS